MSEQCAIEECSVSDDADHALVTRDAMHVRDVRLEAQLHKRPAAAEGQFRGGVFMDIVPIAVTCRYLSSDLRGGAVCCITRFKSLVRAPPRLTKPAIVPESVNWYRAQFQWINY